MTMFVVQTAILLAIAFILGCLIGHLLRMVIASDTKTQAPDEAVTHASAAISTPNSEASATAKPVTEKQDTAAVTSGSADDTAAATAVSGGGVVKSKVPTKTTKSTTSRSRATSKPVSRSRSTGKTGADTSKASKAAGKSGGETTTGKTKAEPATKTPAKTVAATTGGSGNTPQKDDLKRILGVGPKLEARMNALGIVSYSQIAAWTKKQQREYGEQLSFSGRIERDGWVSQAKRLSKEKEASHTKQVNGGKK